MGIILPRKPKLKKRGLFNGLLLKLVGAAIAIGCVITIITINKDCSNKENELSELQTKIDTLETKNSALQRDLNSEDRSSYIERIAMEEHGYAYPDERRFYDTSRD